MAPDEVPPTTPGPSGSRWEPGEGDTTTPADRVTEAATAAQDPAPTTDATAADAIAAPTTRPRRRLARIGAGIAAALVLAGGGFAAGHAVGEDAHDGPPGSSVGHHHDRDAAPDGDATGQGTTAPSGTATGGRST